MIRDRLGILLLVWWLLPQAFAAAQVPGPTAPPGSAPPGAVSTASPPAASRPGPSPQTTTPPAAQPPVFTNQTAFRIPFRYDPAEIARLGAREIRLYVSVDSGRSWQQVQSVAPSAKHFDYRVARDGEYWFAVRTLDRNNRLYPVENPMRPGLKVVVDTQPPQLDLQLSEPAPGRVELSWTCSDAHLDINTLVLEFIQPGAEGWQPVGVLPTPSDRTSWPVPEGGRVAVRARVSDRAGNTARQQSQLEITPAVVPPRIPGTREPLAGSGIPSESNGTTGAGLPPTTVTAPRNGGSVVVTPGLPGAAAASNSASVSWPGNSATTATVPPLPGNADSAVPAWPNANAGYGAAEPAAASARFRPVNSREFDVAYRIDDVGPSGVGRVELFITQDNGQKWWKYGDDPDRQSPFHVQVPDDGVYGFAIRVHSGVGIADPPPQPGQPPDIVIVVDQTPPLVQLLPVQQGQGRGTNTLVIQWRATDQNFPEQPIALSYAAQPNGPWEPITGWLPNSGRYVWSVRNGLPSRLYIRVTARDLAGNLSAVQTHQPVIVDLARPTARIVDVAAPHGPR